MLHIKYEVSKIKVLFRWLPGYAKFKLFKFTKCVIYTKQWGWKFQRYWSCKKCRREHEEMVEAGIYIHQIVYLLKAQHLILTNIYVSQMHGHRFTAKLASASIKMKATNS